MRDDKIYHAYSGIPFDRGKNAPSRGVLIEGRTLPGEAKNLNIVIVIARISHEWLNLLVQNFTSCTGAEPRLIRPAPCMVGFTIICID